MTQALNNKHKLNGTSFPLKEYIISFALSTALAAVLLLLGCAIAYKTDDPDSIYRYVSYAALFVSVLAGGFLTGRITGADAVGGALNGVWFILLTSAVALIIPGETLGFWISFAIRLALLPLGFAGGFLGRKKEKKKNFKRIMKSRRR